MYMCGDGVVEGHDGIMAANTSQQMGLVHTYMHIMHVIDVFLTLGVQKPKYMLSIMQLWNNTVPKFGKGWKGHAELEKC